MTEQDLEQKFDEILMFIIEGKVRNGRNIFAHAVTKAVNTKLDEVIAILERNEAPSLVDEIRQLKS